MRHLCVTVLLLCICVSCVRTKETLIDPAAPKLPELEPESVRIVTDESELEGVEYTRVAMIEATGSGSFTDQSGMIEAMRKKAAKLGANAILLPSIDEPGSGAKVAAAIFGTDTSRKGNAIAIFIHPDQ